LLEDDKVLKFAKQIAVAMTFLHKKKLVHQNLKSSNVLIFDDWSVKISDFTTDPSPGQPALLLQKLFK